MIFSACPELDDYAHSFTLEPDVFESNRGHIHMIDKGGQLINYTADGNYEIIITNDDCELSITNLVGESIFTKSKIIVPDYTVKFKKEEKITYLQSDGSIDHLKVKYIRSLVKYSFDKDPLEHCLKYRRNNPMFMIVSEPEELRRVYYQEYEEVERGELIKNKEIFAPDGYYFHDINLDSLKSSKRSVLVLVERIKADCETIIPKCWDKLVPMIDMACINHIKRNHRWTEWMLTSYYDNSGSIIGFYLIEIQPYNPEEDESRQIIVQLIGSKTLDMFKIMCIDMCRPIIEHPEINQELVTDKMTPDQQNFFMEAVNGLGLEVEF
jgi:hypothetical protein